MTGAGKAAVAREAAALVAQVGLGEAKEVGKEERAEAVRGGATVGAREVASVDPVAWECNTDRIPRS